MRMLPAPSRSHLQTQVPRWQRESHIAQVLNLEAQVDACAFHTAVTQEVAYCLQRCAAPKEIHSHPMAKDIRATKPWHTHIGACRPIIKCVTNRRGQDRTLGRPDTQKQLSRTGMCRSVAKICYQCCRDFICERNSKRSADLGPWHGNHPSSPLDVIQLQAADFTASEAIGSNQ